LSTENEILTAISDLREANDEKEELQARIVKLKDELEGAEDDLQGTELEIERVRDKLDQLIDEPAQRVTRLIMRLPCETGSVASKRDSRR
jgi:predicted  nucleic acid-binding Zn-ribbon protein